MHKFDPDEVDKSFTAALRAMAKANKQFKGEPVGAIAAQAKEEIEAFRPFIPVVVALRNLREQRTSDLEQLGCYRDALVDICHIAMQEAPASQPVTSMIARLQSDGLLPYTARFDVSGTK